MYNPERIKLKHQVYLTMARTIAMLGTCKRLKGWCIIP